MQPFFKHIVLLLVVALPPCVAQTFHAPPPGDDDTLSYTLKQTVLVTANRLRLPFAETPGTVQLFTRERIETLPAKTVADAVDLSAGTAIRAYGGEGGLRLGSIRGLGAEYTLVLLNGVRLNKAQISLVDLGAIAMENVEQMEIARGGYGTLYGSDAIGGVVSVSTKSRGAPLRFTASGGSFGYRGADVSSSWRSGSLQTMFTAGYDGADNAFTFTGEDPVQGMIPFTRSGSDYERKRASAQFTLPLERSTVAFYTGYYGSSVGAPGAFTKPVQGRAHQDDDLTVASLQYGWQASEDLLITLNPSVVYAFQRYADPDLITGAEALNSVYDNVQSGFSGTAQATLTPGISTLFGTDILFSTLHSDEVTGSPQRLTAALFATVDFKTALLGREVHVRPSARVEHIRAENGRDPMTVAMPGAALYVHIIDRILALHASAARAFKNPTFNQLYWAQGGNPDLRPEYSFISDGGLCITPMEEVQLDATYFRHDVTDKIAWAPSQGMYWIPQNLEHVLSQGIEATMTAGLFRNMFSLSLNGAWTQTRKLNASFPGDAAEGKQLIYVPEFRTASTLAARPFTPLTVAVIHRYTGERYYRHSGEEESAAFSADRLESYHLFDCSVAASASPGGIPVTLKLDVLNAFDTVYDAVKSYPMPGRSFILSLTTSLQ